VDASHADETLVELSLLLSVRPKRRLLDSLFWSFALGRAGIFRGDPIGVFVLGGHDGPWRPFILPLSRRSVGRFLILRVPWSQKQQRSFFLYLFFLDFLATIECEWQQSPFVVSFDSRDQCSHSMRAVANVSSES